MPAPLPNLPDTDPNTLRTPWDRFHPIERRVLDYERAWTSLQRNDDAAIEALRTEHQSRADLWSKRTGIQQSSTPSGKHFTLPRPPTWRMELAALLLCIGWAVTLGLLLRYDALNELVAAVLLAALFFSIPFQRFHRRRKLHNKPPWQARTLINRSCPNCSYDLSNSPNDIPPEKLDDWPTGPRQCSECGALWPLIPSGDIEKQLRNAREESPRTEPTRETAPTGPNSQSPGQRPG